MRGELFGVWSETWREIWVKMAKHPEYGDDLFSDLYRQLVPEPTAPQLPPPPEDYTDDGELARIEDIEARDAYEEEFKSYVHKRAQYEEVVGDGQRSRSACHLALKEKIRNETDAIAALDKANNIISSYDDEPFYNRYFLLVESFLTKYSLRYDLRRPFSLHPTLPGIFAGLIRELKKATSQDIELHPLMVDFEEAIRDLGLGASPGRMKTCFNKQFNLLEALAGKHPDVTTNTLGRMCGELNTWPHATVMEAAKKIYGFRAYPGVGHGAQGGVLREIEMRDLVAVSVMLAGFSPYLTDLINSDSIYHGS